MKINYYFKNVDSVTEKKEINVDKSLDLLSFNIDQDIFKIDIKNDVLRKENNDSLLILKFNKNKKENGSYYIKELDSIFDVKIKTNHKDKEDKYHVNYTMWLDDELIGDFELKIEYKE